MAKINLKQNEGVRTTDQAAPVTNPHSDFRFAGISAMSRASDKLANSIAYVGRAVGDIAKDQLRMKNEIAVNSAQIDIAESEIAFNENMLKRMNAGEFKDFETFKNAYVSEYAANIEKPLNEKYQKEGLSDSARHSLAVFFKKSQATNFARMGGEWMRSQNALLVEKTMQNIDKCVSAGDIKGVELSLESVSPLISPETCEKIFYKAKTDIAVNNIVEMQTLADINSSGKAYATKMAELQKGLIEGKYADLPRRTALKFAAAFQGEISRGLREQELIKEQNSEGAKENLKAKQELDAAYKTTEEGIVKSAEDMRAYAQKNLSGADLAKAYAQIYSWEKQQIINIRESQKKISEELSKPYKDEIAQIAKNALQTQGCEIRSESPLFKGAFDPSAPSRLSGESDSEEFLSISKRIYSLDFQKNDADGLKRAEILQDINDSVRDPFLRKSLLKKLLYKTADASDESAYGFSKAQLDSLENQLFPEAKANEDKDPGYAAFLSAFREYIGVYSDSKSAISFADFLAIANKDPKIKALIDVYNGDTLVRGLALQEIEKSDIPSIAKFSAGLGEMLSDSPQDGDKTNYQNLTQNRARAEELLFKSLNSGNLK